MLPLSILEHLYKQTLLHFLYVTSSNPTPSATSCVCVSFRLYDVFTDGGLAIQASLLVYRRQETPFLRSDVWSKEN